MTDLLTTPRSNSSIIIDEVRSMLPRIASAAAQGERDRAVPADILKGLRNAGVFRMALPSVWGGGQLGLAESAEVISEVARADVSTGWVCQVGSMISAFLRALPRETLDDEVFAHGADLMFRGAVAPKGQAIEVPGGYRISGRWPLASGCYEPDWMLAGFTVADAAPLPDGRPDLRVALFRPEQITFLDTWDAIGLRATQSNDFTMDDVFVPTRHTASLFLGNNFPSPVYGLPYSPTGSSHDAVVIGALHGALDDLGDIAKVKRPAFNPRALLADDPNFATAYGELDLRTEALVGLHQTCTAAVMRSADAGEEPNPLEWQRHLASHQHIHHEGTRIMNDIMTLAGSSALPADGTLGRRWRDLRCVAQHVAANNGQVKTLGALRSH